MKVLVVGKNGFLARSIIAAAPKDVELTAVSHADKLLEHLAIKQDLVINCAFAPALRRGGYDFSVDIDKRIATAITCSKTHYAMLSSRKVYGVATNFCLDEQTPLNPESHYGENKARIEQHVREILANRHTILRAGNVFGFEPGRHTFFGAALRNLREAGRIELDAGPTSRRDFIAVVDFAALLWRAVLQMPLGTFNIATGVGTQLGDIAKYLIAGYGSGELVVTTSAEKDSFVLDVSKLENLVGPIEYAANIPQACKDIGKRLKVWKKS